MQVPVLNGTYVDKNGDFRTAYPRNLIPVPKGTGISNGYLAPGEGIRQIGVGPGNDRGGFNWEGVCYRVMGTKLVRVWEDNTISVLGEVGAGGPVTMDPGFGRLAIWSGGGLYYWDGTSLTKVTDPDLGTVIDGRWIGGYFMSTDGQYLIVTELNDPTQVNPLKYGSSEADPDPIMAVDELRNEAYALNRFTIEVLDNVGGDNFPFQRIDGALVPKGIVGTFAYAQFLETFAFVGSGRNEAPAVWQLGAGTAGKLSTREIDIQLGELTEEQLAAVYVESKVGKNHQLLLIHLPNECWVYDAAASAVAGEPVWYSQDSGLGERKAYRARSQVWCYGRWIVGDPTSSALGEIVGDLGEHLGEEVGTEFMTTALYNGGNEAIVGELELVGTPGRVPLGANPTIWTSYSDDGETWSQERGISAGKSGQRAKRLVWRDNGVIRNYRMQRFRSTSALRASIARLEMELEPLDG